MCRLTIDPPLLPHHHHIMMSVRGLMSARCRVNRLSHCRSLVEVLRGGCGVGTTLLSSSTHSPAVFSSTTSSSTIIVRSFSRQKLPEWEQKERLERMTKRRAIPDDSERYGHKRGHSCIKRQLREHGRTCTQGSVDRILRSYLYQRHALKAGYLQISHLSPPAMAKSFLGESTRQEFSTDEGKQIILELWYHGTSDYLEWKKEREQLRIERKEMILSGVPKNDPKFRAHKAKLQQSTRMKPFAALCPFQA